MPGPQSSKGPHSPSTSATATESTRPSSITSWSAVSKRSPPLSYTASTTSRPPTQDSKANVRRPSIHRSTSLPPVTRTSSNALGLSTHERRASEAQVEPQQSNPAVPDIWVDEPGSPSVAPTRPPAQPSQPSFLNPPSPAEPIDLHRPALAAASQASSFCTYHSSVTQEEARKPYDSEKELQKVSRSLLRLQKYGLLLALVSINGVLIFAAACYHKYYWIFLPFLSVNTFSQVIFAISITVAAAYQAIYRAVFRIKEPIPDTPEKFVMILPCYNEDRNEVETSLNSLVNQVKISEHPRLIMVVVDGNAKAPGETMSTQEFLLNDMFAGGTRVKFENGYCARDGFFMPVTIQHGFYKGLPYVIVGKRYNQGKRDSLCFARSFLWHYQNRSVGVPTIFNPALFDYLASIMISNGLDTVDYLCGMDGDTTFDTDCVYELIKAMRWGGPKVVGVCGAVLVKFDEKPWGLWNLLQNTEYNLTQGLRREFQSRVTGKVNCLPGCCQLIRVREATFGDVVLRDRFGYVPKPNDIMTRQIMGVYSEDSIHASIIFSQYPQSQTRQALRARAYTTAPQSWPVYLSQRKRWALGSKSNEFVMIFRPGILWVERICSIITVVTWWIGPFVVAAVISLIVAFARLGPRIFDNKLMVGLLSVLLARYVYSLLIVVWFPHTWMARVRFLLGFCIYVFASPVMNLIITAYALLHSDEFSWGKTRAVATGDDEDENAKLLGDAPGGTGVDVNIDTRKEATDLQTQIKKFEEKMPPL